MKNTPERYIFYIFGCRHWIQRIASYCSSFLHMKGGQVSLCTFLIRWLRNLLIDLIFLDLWLTISI